MKLGSVLLMKHFVSNMWQHTSAINDAVFSVAHITLASLSGNNLTIGMSSCEEKLSTERIKSILQ
jgi:hypothetical protein